MDDNRFSIDTGNKVYIKRTNGRIHSAIVCGISWLHRTLTVEWVENGETKGKEVEMDAIADMNPEFIMEPPWRSYMSKHSTKPSIPVKAGSSKQTSRQAGRPTNIMPSGSTVNGLSGTLPAFTARREVDNVLPTPTATPAIVNVTSVAQAKQKQQQQLQSQQQQQQQQQQQLQQQQQQQVQVENGRGRRSNVVKEVERLKKNREERRQRQAELKEEKEALMNLDPGNPNWEFLAMIREYQSSIEFRPLRETDVVEDHQITVCVRKRPLNKKEITRKEVDVITVPSKDQIVVHEPKAKVDLTKYLENQIFRFDYAFDESCNNEIVYKYTAKPLVHTIFEGGMATCFAYGQTGSGKTHTMGGDFNGKTQDYKKGIYAMVAKDVFKCIKLEKYRPLNLVISASFFEIYSGKVFDLLANKEKLRVLEDGKQQVQIVGLTEKMVETCDEVLKLIQHGNSARTSGQTSANSNSSRSHAVFQIIARTPGTHKVHGKFSLIDLAGNERGADTSSANRQTRMEGAEINKSLLALKECIRALSRKGTHLPFRASKLTQVLRDSFIGEKSKTCMIAMISPGMYSCEHSLNTLRYADRVKELAATDPTEVKVSPTDDERELKIEEQSNNSVLSDSDLAQLRSLNEGEISQDLYTFHEAVSALQMLEEEVLDTHKVVMDHTTKFLNDAHNVFSATHEVDYDQEDSRGKDKARASYPLEPNLVDKRTTTATATTTTTTTTRTTTTTTTEPVKKVNEVASDSDAWCNITRTIDTSRKKSLKSPWMEEMERINYDSSCDSDYESLNVSRTTGVAANVAGVDPRGSCVGNLSRKNGTHANTPTERSFGWSVNRAQRLKRSVAGWKRAEKYHWSGTFNDRVKRYSSLGNRRTNGAEEETLRSLSDHVSCNDRATIADSNYNYNFDAFDNGKAGKKTKLFPYDKYNLEDERSESKEKEKDLRDRRSSANTTRDKFNIPEQSWVLREQEDDQRDRGNATSQETDLSTDPPTSRGCRRNDERTRFFGSFSGSSDRVNNSRDDDRSTIIDRYEITLSTVYVRKSCSSIDGRYKLKFCHFLLSLFKNIILFTFLPSLYVVFFVYAKRAEER